MLRETSEKGRSRGRQRNKIHLEINLCPCEDIRILAFTGIYHI